MAEAFRHPAPELRNALRLRVSGLFEPLSFSALLRAVFHKNNDKPQINHLHTTMKHLLFAALAALTLSCTAGAADKKDEKKDKDSSSTADASGHTLGEFKIGASISGPEVKLEDLKGKAVVIEHWGIHCGPCLASLPEMQKISKRYKHNLVLIGAHSQEATDDEVKAVVKKNKLTYSIVKGSNTPSDVSSGTIPHAYVFDAEGKLVFHGLPSDPKFDKALHKALPKKA
jgi:thiol-disulfide isomerase/thioredoxin